MYRTFIRRLVVTVNPILQFKYRPPKVVFGKCVCKNLPSSSNPTEPHPTITVIPKSQEPVSIEEYDNNEDECWEGEEYDQDTTTTVPLASTSYIPSSYAPKPGASTANKVIDGVGVCSCRRKQDPTNGKLYLYHPVSLDRAHQVREERNRRQRKREVIKEKSKKASWGKTKTGGYNSNNGNSGWD